METEERKNSSESKLVLLGLCVRARLVFLLAEFYIP